MAGSSVAATIATAASTGSICARLRAPCSANWADCAPNSPRPRLKASTRPTRTACSDNSKPSRKTSATRSRARTKKRKRKKRAMADPVLKFPAEQKGVPPDSSPKKIAAEPRRRLLAGLRKYRRFLLLVVLPLAAGVGGVAVYLSGGRYVTTDDAYVGAQKVLITPDISGKIEKVVVREGQQVKDGDVLFEIDPVPFRLAVASAKPTLDQARGTYDNLCPNIKTYGKMADLTQQGIDLKQRDVDRKSALVKSNVGSQLDLDNSGTALVTAAAQAQFVKQQLSNAKTQLLGNPELPIEEFPPYAQAKAALDQAERNLA